jgi:hypothetical protein
MVRANGVPHGFRIRCLGLTLLALVLLPSAAWALVDDLYQPAAIAIPCALPADKLKSTLRESLAKRGWKANEEGEREFEAVITRKIIVPEVAKVKAAIAVAWDDRQVTLRYVNSEGLEYRQDGNITTINTSYNKWLRNVEHDFRANLGKACG